MAPFWLGQLVLSGAASELLRPLFEERCRPLELVAASTRVVHLATGDQRVPLITMVPSNGVRLPGGVLLGASDTAAAHWAEVQSATGSAATIGAGVLQLGALVVRPVRWWDGARPRPMAAVTSSSVAAVRVAFESAARPLDTATRTAVQRLETAVKDFDAVIGATVAAIETVEWASARAAAAARVEAAANSMVGLGPGLTPACDDVLVGALVALWHLERCASGSARPRLSALRSAVVTGTSSCAGRTTAVSTALLVHALKGEGMPVLLDLVALVAPITAPLAHHPHAHSHAHPPGLVESGWFTSPVPNHQPPIADGGERDGGERDGRERIKRAAERVAAVGHDTGSAMLRGVAIAARCAVDAPRATIAP